MFKLSSVGTRRSIHRQSYDSSRMYDGCATWILHRLLFTKHVAHMTGFDTSGSERSQTGPINTHQATHIPPATSPYTYLAPSLNHAASPGSIHCHCSSLKELSPNQPSEPKTRQPSNANMQPLLDVTMWITYGTCLLTESIHNLSQRSQSLSK